MQTEKGQKFRVFFTTISLKLGDCDWCMCLVSNQVLILHCFVVKQKQQEQQQNETEPKNGEKGGQKLHISLVSHSNSLGYVC